MEWDFSPEDVMSGNVDYTVAEFREDLLEEILSNIADFGGDDITKGFYSIMTIILCTSLAFGKSSDSVIASIKKYFSNEIVVQKLLTNKEFLKEIKEDNKENIRMLQAVIHRRMRDDVEKGLTPGTVAKTITAELMDFR